ncbi:MAG: hypothetical protein ACRD47_14645 [Nitrososphaeraceae archaeon]
MIHAGFSATSALFFILVTGLLLFSGITVHLQVGLGQKNESGKLDSSTADPPVTLENCMAAVGKPLSQGISLLFVSACLAFAPTVFKSIGDTLYLNDGVDPVPGVDPLTSKSDDVDSTSGDDGTSTDRSNDDSTSGDDGTSTDRSNDDSTSDSLDHNSDDGPSD